MPTWMRFVAHLGFRLAVQRFEVDTISSAGLAMSNKK